MLSVRRLLRYVEPWHWGSTWRMNSLGTLAIHPLLQLASGTFHGKVPTFKQSQTISNICTLIFARIPRIPRPIYWRLPMVKQILRKSLNLDRWLLRQGRDYGFYLGAMASCRSSTTSPSHCWTWRSGWMPQTHGGLPWITMDY